MQTRLRTTSPARPAAPHRPRARGAESDRDDERQRRPGSQEVAGVEVVGHDRRNHERKQHAAGADHEHHQRAVTLRAAGTGHEQHEREGHEHEPDREQERLPRLAVAEDVLLDELSEAIGQRPAGRRDEARAPVVLMDHERHQRRADDRDRRKRDRRARAGQHAAPAQGNQQPGDLAGDDERPEVVGEDRQRADRSPRHQPAAGWAARARAGTPTATARSGGRAARRCAPPGSTRTGAGSRR